MRPCRTLLAVLLGDLQAAGIKLRLDGDRIAVSPRSDLTPDLRGRLLGFREDVLGGLRSYGGRLLPMFAYGPGEQPHAGPSEDVSRPEIGRPAPAETESVPTPPRAEIQIAFDWRTP